MPWTVHVEGGPRRVNHAAIAVNNKIFSFGGYCTGDDYKVVRPMDVHVLNTENYRWSIIPTSDSSVSSKEIEVPFQRYGHTAVLYDDKVYVWGGRNDEAACNVLYCFNTKSLIWSCPLVHGEIPGARDGHSACVIGCCMYIFGGYEDDNDEFSQEVYVLNLKTMEWKYLKTKGEPPSFRDFHSATAIGNRMYVFGGRGNRAGPYNAEEEVYCDEIIYLDALKQRWCRPAVHGFKPVGRRSHSAFCYKDCLFVFGGYNGIFQKHYNDLLRFDLETCRWSVVKPRGQGPCPRRRQSCCVIGDRVFLFGGTSPHPDPDAVRRHGDHLNEHYGPEPPEPLMDHNDLFVLDFAPSLKTLAILTVIEHKISAEALPQSIRLEIRAMTMPNNLTKPLNTSG